MFAGENECRRPKFPLRLAPGVGDQRVSSVFVPEHSLQGEDFPVHILWKGGGQTTVTVTLPPELELREAFNVSQSNNNQLIDRTLRVADVEVPGFVGLLVRSRKLPEASKQVSVSVEVAGADGEPLRRTERQVLLFRPLLQPVSLPSLIAVTGGSGRNLKLEPRPAVSNVGDGTAFVQLLIKDGSRASIGPPAGLDQFEEKFAADAVAGLSAAKTDFPQFGRLLDRLGRIVQIRRNLSPEDRRLFRTTARQAQRAYEESPDFRSRIIRVVGEAYFKNLEVITEVASFLDYLSAIGKGRVFVLNALDVLRIPAGGTVVQLELRIADAGLKAYPSLPLGAISFVSEAPREVPVHALVDWVGGQAEEEEVA